MVNFIASIILLGIAVFVITLFPGGKDFIGDITSSVTEKKDNVIEEYERVRGEVDEITDTVTETKDNIEETVDAVGAAVDTASDALDKINELLGDEDEVTDEDIKNKTSYAVKIDAITDAARPITIGNGTIEN